MSDLLSKMHICLTEFWYLYSMNLIFCLIFVLSYHILKLSREGGLSTE